MIEVHDGLIIQLMINSWPIGVFYPPTISNLITTLSKAYCWAWKYFRISIRFSISHLNTCHGFSRCFLNQDRDWLLCNTEDNENIPDLSHSEIRLRKRKKITLSINISRTYPNLLDMLTICTPSGWNHTMWWGKLPKDCFCLRIFPHPKQTLAKHSFANFTLLGDYKELRNVLFISPQILKTRAVCVVQSPPPTPKKGTQSHHYPTFVKKHLGVWEGRTFWKSQMKQGMRQGWQSSMPATKCVGPLSEQQHKEMFSKSLK